MVCVIGSLSEEEVVGTQPQEEGGGMNVTKANWDEAYEEIARLLPDCEFVAMDCEMTGINMEGPAFRSTYGDNPQVRKGYR